MKWVFRIFGVLLAVLILAGVVGYMYYESVVVSNAEKIASRELGVPVTIGGFRIGFVNKDVTISHVKIGNPDGFKTPYFVNIPKIHIQASDKLISNPITVEQIDVTGLTAFYEVSEHGNNLKKIQQNMLKSAQSKPAASETAAKEKTGFVIKSLRISDAVLTPAISIAGQGAQENVPIPTIQISNLGTEGKPVIGREVVLRVMTSLVTSIQTSALPKLVINQVSDNVIKGVDKAKEALGGAIDGLFGK